MFTDKLVAGIKKLDNPTVAGLDPKLEYVPGFIREKVFNECGYNFEGAAEALLQFNKKLIDALYDIVPAIKPQLAYYEMYGTAGVKAFADTCTYAGSKGMLVIADGKRNDIGSTAEAYSTAYLGKTPIGPFDGSAFSADAITVNPYLGYDGIKPFIDDCGKFGKGIFILVKTSNKSSGQLQDLITSNGKTIYETVADLVNEWGSQVVGESGYSGIGAVVGATYPEQSKILRGIMKKAYILVPGYGAQGGTAKDAAHSFDSNGLGAVINASRSIMCAWKSERWSADYEEDAFDSAARAEAIRMRDEINQALAGRERTV
jgi:orotidine-5'-phosphate decarboxylase